MPWKLEPSVAAIYMPSCLPNKATDSLSVIFSETGQLPGKSAASIVREPEGLRPARHRLVDAENENAPRGQIRALDDPP